MDEEMMDTLVTIPLKELDKYIHMAEKQKYKKKSVKTMDEVHTKWWQEKCKECEELQKENAELRKNLDDAKAHIAELVGIKKENRNADDGR